MQDRAFDLFVTIIVSVIVPVLAVGAGWAVAAPEASKRIRATELTPRQWTQFERGELEDFTIEFRAGDRMPLRIRAEGDLLETIDPPPIAIAVKRRFFVRLQQKRIEVSLDGREFQPFNKLLTGSFTLGARGDDVDRAAQGIDAVFKGFLRAGVAQ